MPLTRPKKRLYRLTINQADHKYCSIVLRWAGLTYIELVGFDSICQVHTYVREQQIQESGSRPGQGWRVRCVKWWKSVDLVVRVVWHGETHEIWKKERQADDYGPRLASKKRVGRVSHMHKPKIVRLAWREIMGKGVTGAEKSRAVSSTRRSVRGRLMPSHGCWERNIRIKAQPLERLTSLLEISNAHSDGRNSNGLINMWMVACIAPTSVPEYLAQSLSRIN